MGGLGFIHVGFLAAAATAAVPILIHLLFRQRARRVEIGTLHFLRVVLRDNARRRKLRRLLLLALRTAGVLLLALMFARPYWSSPDISGDRSEVVLLVDRSASMGAGRPDRSPFARARQAAERVIRNLPSGTSAHLTYFDATGVTPAREARLDPAIKPGPAGTDFGKAIGWARDLLVRSRRADRKVYLFTDLQRSGLARSPLEGRFPAEIAVEVVDVGRPLTKNLAIDDVLATRTDLRPGEPTLVAARLLNAGPFVARDVTVRLSLAGAGTVQQSATVTVEGGSRQVVRFSVPLKHPGVYRGFVEVSGDDELPFDNRRWLAFEARNPDRILLVDGEPGPTVFGNETYYLETALRLRVPGQEDKGTNKITTPFEPIRIAWDRSLPDLAPYRVVVLCNVADIPPAAARTLESFVTAGGALVVFTGDRVRPESNKASSLAGLLPASVEGPADVGLYRFASWEKGHPLLRPFADPQSGDLRVMKFRRIHRLTPAEGARVLAGAQGGRPLLVETTKGKGTVLIFASAVDNEWGDWTIHRLYLPFIYQMMAYLTDRLPENGRVRSAPAGDGPDEMPGLARTGDLTVVRNADPAESVADRASPAEFRKAFGLPELVKTAFKGADEPMSMPDGSQRPDEIWRWFAWGLLIVLVAETFVANRTHT